MFSNMSRLFIKQNTVTHVPASLKIFKSNLLNFEWMAQKNITLGWLLKMNIAMQK